MSVTKCALNWLLGCCVLAANTVCACAGIDSEHSSQHASQQMHESHSAHHANAHTHHHAANQGAEKQLYSISCADLACEECELAVLSMERDVGVKLFAPGCAQSTLIQVSAASGQSSLFTSASDPPLPYLTPTTRFDISLK